MKIEIKKEDLINMVAGSNMPLRIETTSDVYKCVSWSVKGFEWNKIALRLLSEESLYNLYKSVNK